MVVSQNNVRFPGTNERVISIRGSIDAIKICVNMIQEKIRYDLILHLVTQINMFLTIFFTQTNNQHVFYLGWLVVYHSRL